MADTTTSKENDNRVFFITTFYTKDTSVKDIVFKNWEILGASSTTTHILQVKVMVGYRRAKKLSDVLVRPAILPITR